MPAEDVQAKGRRYLLEGRLTIRLVDVGRVQAHCRGQGAFYTLGYQDGDWFCGCPAKGLCCHLVALQLVVARSGGGQ